MFSPDSEMDHKETQVLRRSEKTEEKVQNSVKEIQTESLQLKNFNEDQFKNICLEDFIVHTLLGEGSFGKVYLV